MNSNKVELWKDIKGYEGLYQVSNFGRVRALDFRQSGHVKVLTTKFRASGEALIILCKKGIVKQYRICRLVAQAFIPNPDKLPQVSHKDGDRANNNASNLKWINPSRAVIQLNKEGIEIARYDSMSSAARIIGGTPSCIYSCCVGHIKSSRGFVWKFQD